MDDLTKGEFQCGRGIKWDGALFCWRHISFLLFSTARRDTAHITHTQYIPKTSHLSIPSIFLLNNHVLDCNAEKDRQGSIAWIEQFTAKIENKLQRFLADNPHGRPRKDTQ